MNKLRLFGFSFLMLFCELSLIRYLPGNIKILGYFANLVLIASFFGIGLGFLISKAKFNLINFFAPLLTTLLLVIAFSKININATEGGLSFLGFFSQDFFRIESPIVLILIFLLVTLVFASLAQEAGRLFAKFKPLEAYSIDISGSVLGVVLFAIVSYLSINAIFWFLIIAVLFLALVWPKKVLIGISLVFLGFNLIFLNGQASIEPSRPVWSPYFKVTLRAGSDENGNQGYLVYINNVFHQFISGSKNRENFYYYPYKVFSNHKYKNILIIGAGAGTDASVALSNDPGVESIDAVEIDPYIANLGRRLNPEKTYEDRRVNVIVDDGRSFLEKTKKKYDLIIYGATDSVILVNNTSGVRLESFLYTTEAFQLVKNHLSDGGVFFLFNYYRDQWVIDKLAAMTQKVFEIPPYLITEGDQFKTSTIINGPGIGEIEQSFSGMKKFVPSENLAPATDDWPFLFLRRRQIPLYYFEVLVVLVLFSLAAYLLFQRVQKKTIFNLSFFAFGAGFMLLETKSLVAFAQLFGSTWLVNSLAITAILSFILLANFINTKIKFRRLNMLYLFLFIFLALQLIVPNSLFASLDLVPRYLLSSTFYFLPIFVANLIFAAKFKNVKDQSQVFGANLLGAVLGGFLEYGALAIGYKYLALFIMLFYFLTFWDFRVKGR